MKHIKTLTVAAALMGASALSAQAQELHFIMCGGEVRPADQVVIDKFIADNAGVTVNMEAVPWGTCQDKSMQLAAAGDPPSIAYMGSRTLRQLAKNDQIVPVTFTAEEEAHVPARRSVDRVVGWPVLGHPARLLDQGAVYELRRDRSRGRRVQGPRNLG